MVEVYRRYLKEVHDKWGYTATWAPNVVVAPGDIGRVQDGLFHRLKSISTDGVDYEIRAPGPAATYEHMSQGGVSITANAAAEGDVSGAGIVPAKGRLKIGFSKNGAVVFLAQGCRELAIQDQDALLSEVSRRLDAGAWPDDQVLVTTVITCDRLTVLIAGEAGGEIEFLLDGDLESGASQIANLSAGMQIAAQSSIATKIIGESNMTPMFKAIGIKRPPLLIGRKRPRFKRGTSVIGESSRPRADDPERREIGILTPADIFDDSDGN